MSLGWSTRRRGLSASVAVLVTGLASLSLATSSVTPAAANASRLARATPTIRMQPLVRRVERGRQSGQSLFTCQDPGSVPACYGPDQIRTAYQVQPLIDHGVTGRGRTIVVVIAYSPTGLSDDVHTFDAAWGLTDPSLSIVAPFGATWDPTNAEQVGWSGEADLDIQWAHVIAPDAKIVVVEGKSSSDADLLAATQYAVDHDLGDVVSHSFGDAEHCLPAALLRKQHAVFDAATRKHITLVAAAGDNGSAQPTCDYTSFAKDVLSPASDPNVLAVGGTRLVADPTSGGYGSETVWNESSTIEAAGGGGFSSAFARPSYQNGAVPGARRGLPDVSYDGAVDGGVLVYWGLGGGWFEVGGTSAGTPQWAGLVALASQVAHHSIGFVNPRLYAVGRSRASGAAFHDITVGDNTYTYLASDGSSVTIPGYPAAKGWDPATGWGSPRAAVVVPLMAAGSKS